MLKTRQDLIHLTTLREWYLMNHVENAGCAVRWAGTDIGRTFGYLARKALVAANRAT